MTLTWKLNSGWVDLMDTDDSTGGTTYAVAYQGTEDKWIVLWSRLMEDEEIPIRKMSEKQLRKYLETKYLLLRGDK